MKVLRRDSLPSLTTAIILDWRFLFDTIFWLLFILPFVTNGFSCNDDRPNQHQHQVHPENSIVYDLKLRLSIQVEIQKEISDLFGFSH